MYIKQNHRSNSVDVNYKYHEITIVDYTQGAAECTNFCLYYAYKLGERQLGNTENPPHSCKRFVFAAPTLAN